MPPKGEQKSAYLRYRYQERGSAELMDLLLLEKVPRGKRERLLPTLYQLLSKIRDYAVYLLPIQRLQSSRFLEMSGDHSGQVAALTKERRGLAGTHV